MTPLTLFYLLGSASAAAFEVATTSPPPLPPPGPITTTYPPGFSHTIGCRVSVLANFTYDCPRVWKSTTTSTYSVDCGDCGDLTYSFSNIGGACPPGLTRIVTATTPYTEWEFACSTKATLFEAVPTAN